MFVLEMCPVRNEKFNCIFKLQSYINCFVVSYKEESEAEETDEDDIIEVSADAVVDYEDDDRETIEKVLIFCILRSWVRFSLRTLVRRVSQRSAECRGFSPGAPVSSRRES
jgi:hypothetical protein